MTFMSDNLILALSTAQWHRFYAFPSPICIGTINYWYEWARNTGIWIHNYHNLISFNMFSRMIVYIYLRKWCCFFKENKKTLEWALTSSKSKEWAHEENKVKGERWLCFLTKGVPFIPRPMVCLWPKFPNIDILVFLFQDLTSREMMDPLHVPSHAIPPPTIFLYCLSVLNDVNLSILQLAKIYTLDQEVKKFDGIHTNLIFILDESALET